MTTNKVITILCASLIATVVLPFSIMNFVEDENNDSPEIQELKKRINALESSKHSDSSTSFELKQYKLALEWFQAEGDPEEQHRIMDLITESFPDIEDYTPGVMVNDSKSRLPLVDPDKEDYTHGVTEAG